MRNLIAILRGVRLQEVEAIVEALLTEGITKIEIPLNSPEPYMSIEKMVRLFEGQGIFGAGTVLQLEQVEKLAAIGTQMIVSPNCKPELIQATKTLGLLSYPGVMTPSEAFAALDAGADGLKLFPGEIVGPTGLKAMRAVLPESIDCIAVGGVNPDSFSQWVQAGATGFGLGSAIYKAGDSPTIVRRKAREIVIAYDNILP